MTCAKRAILGITKKIRKSWKWTKVKENDLDFLLVKGLLYPFN